MPRITQILKRPIFVALATVCLLSAQGEQPPDPAVVLRADNVKIAELDDVTFTARVRPDLMRTMQVVAHPGDPFLTVPHVIGWRWIPDLDVYDPWTKACETRDLVCSTSLHASGTMVFAIRTIDQVCADWIHVDVLLLRNFDEPDSTERVRLDSTSMSIKTKMPVWKRCTA